MLRKAVTFCHQLLLLARRCAKGPAQRLHVIRDYCQLYRQKGLTMEEYDEFEFENARRPSGMIFSANTSNAITCNC